MGALDFGCPHLIYLPEKFQSMTGLLLRTERYCRPSGEAKSTPKRLLTPPARTGPTTGRGLGGGSTRIRRARKQRRQIWPPNSLKRKPS